MENGKKPINPIVASNGFVTNEINYNNRGLNGLTKREYFAGIAMQGWIACQSESFRGDESSVAEKAIKYADELLKQLEK